MENLEVISKIHEKKSFNSKVECVGSNPVGGVYVERHLLLEHRLHNRNKMATGAVVEATDR